MERVYVNDEHSNTLMKSMTKLWKERKYCDAVIDVNSEHIELHKLVLLAASPSIIHKVNSITDTGTIVIKLEGKCYSKKAAKLCVQYLYKGIAKLNDTNVKAVTKIAEALELKEILEICSSFQDTFKLMKEESSDADKESDTSLDADKESDIEEEQNKEGNVENISKSLTEEALDKMKQTEEKSHNRGEVAGVVHSQIPLQSTMGDVSQGYQFGNQHRPEVESAMKSIEGTVDTVHKKGVFKGKRKLGLHLSTCVKKTTYNKRKTRKKSLVQKQDKTEVSKTETALDPAVFYQELQNIGIDFFCGVPDSLLKDVCAYITKNTPEENHIITANEGNAIGLAAGYHLATGQVALVYLQNSGLGNTVNPLLSLADRDVYSIPMLLLIGWRGEPGIKDEPQHVVQGRATEGLLSALGIPYNILPTDAEKLRLVLKDSRNYMDNSLGPYALLVKKGTFSPCKLPKEVNIEFPLTRETAVKRIIDSLGPLDVVIGTTGMLSRELYEYRVALGQGHERDFLTVGSMGHASTVALGIALKKPNRQVFCLDGDGAAIMHMGSQAIIGQEGPANLKHVIINNGAHDSVGGQPTVARNHDSFSFQTVAKGCGYKETLLASTEDEISTAVKKMRAIEGPCLLEIKVAKGARSDLGRPKTTPIENKQNFMMFLKNAV